MGVDLKKYNEKRDFEKTSEPRGNRGKKSAQRFCIQQHHASHLHYDLRIENEGVLLSWAVPKGPSADPKVKRLAMETEPHPLEYLTFEGTIPKGNYGAGKMIVWDIGTFEIPEGGKNPDKVLSRAYEEGIIDIIFNGQKIKGLYKLVLTDKKKRQWLFFKKKDAFAGKGEFEKESVVSGRLVDEVEEADNPLAKVLKNSPVKPFPEVFKPMLAKLTDEIFDSKDWIYEVKYDGYRCLVFKKEGEIQLISRNGNNLNGNYPALVKAAADLAPDGVFDGEIIVANESGGGDFQLLQQYLQQNKAEQPIRLILFDLLYLHDRDLTQQPLILRKKALEKILEPVNNGFIKYSDHIEEQGTEFFSAAAKMNLEGVIAKKKSSVYLKNKRGTTWLKIKNVLDDDLPVIGVTPSPDKSRAFGALLLGQLSPEGKMAYAGKVGTGFSAARMKKIYSQLEEYKIAEPPVKLKEKVLFWVKPHLLAKVKYTEKTREGKLRHPSFLELRNDKFFNPEQKAPKEKKAMSKKVKTEKATTAKKEKTTSKKSAGKATKLSSSQNFSNLDKVFFPDAGITKGDILQYYDEMSEYIIPFLKDRPLTLKRTPNGILDKGFYQKDVEGDVPSFVKTAKVTSTSGQNKTITYALCNNRETLLFLANWGCVELHSMNSRKQHIDNPDHIVFDLDPTGQDIEELKEAALTLKEMLDDWKIYSAIKTSGSRGLHIYVPIRPQYTHEQVRDTSYLIAKKWHQKLPKTTSLERMPDKRKNKVYLDFLQNGRSKTMASIYSLRVKPGAPVSMPLEWSELEALKSISDFNIHNVPELVKSRPNPWKDLYRHRQTLEAIVERL